MHFYLVDRSVYKIIGVYTGLMPMAEDNFSHPVPFSRRSDRKQVGHFCSKMAHKNHRFLKMLLFYVILAAFVHWYID
jgi:hypothetical protein